MGDHQVCLTLVAVLQGLQGANGLQLNPNVGIRISELPDQVTKQPGIGDRPGR